MSCRSKCTAITKVIEDIVHTHRMENCGVSDKGMIDLAYRSGQISSIQAHVVYENDTFEYSFGLEPTLKHVPAMSNRGTPVAVYAVFKTKDEGYGYEVMSWNDVMDHAKRFSKSFDNGPWQTNTEEMAKKTVLKKVLKYAPLSSEFVKGAAADGTVKDQISDDMSDIPSLIVDSETGEVVDKTDDNGD